MDGAQIASNNLTLEKSRLIDYGKSTDFILKDEDQIGLSFKSCMYKSIITNSVKTLTVVDNNSINPIQ